PPTPWSSHARRRPPLPGHTHKNCANCIDYALAWRQRVINQTTNPSNDLEAAA
ncbi:deazapurine DNA modification protein DpdA family protein, partial [Streptomyces sampsonii]|uniref:deazapurine DNA modification protein DpdA family protein n=1 Tax=Streptomyces sampsonii TaxID=42239 RepID=UPI003FA26C2C